MLVTFKTQSHSDISMFGEVSKGFLKMMGLSGEVPGAIVAADIPDALSALREAISKSIAEDDESAANSTDDEQAVGLETRAKPLLELLESAQASGDSVMWEH